jgi:hypothetical protein
MKLSQLRGAVLEFNINKGFKDKGSEVETRPENTLISIRFDR